MSLVRGALLLCLAGLSHCGTDAFQLLRTTEGWRIVALADTYQAEGCARREPPAP